jgi:hypothetical protein
MERKKTRRKTRKSISVIQSERKATFRAEYITNYQTAEAIVKTILDKIINLSIRQSGINKINNQLKGYCFKYIQNQIEPLFEENYINYTKSKNNSNIFFWKNKKPKENEWIEIKEPETPQNDRFEGVFTHLKELESKNKKLKMTKIQEGLENDKLNNNEKDNSSRDDNEKTQKNKQIKKKLILSETPNKEEENNTNINKQKVQQNNPNQNQNQNSKSKKIQMINFPSIDIPDIDKEFIHDEFDPPNINKLRREREEEIKRKERERKLLMEEKKMAKKKDDSEKINKKFKQLDSNKFTFDSNGKIISFKQYRLENLSKDFNFIKNTIKDSGEGIKSNKKKMISMKDQLIKINEEIIKNPAEEEKKEKIEKIEKKEKIIPSGSNFQIMLPNIGVVIKENQKIKEGGREFNKFFNKYSIHDYDKILNDYVPLQNKTKMRTKLEKMNLTTPNNIIQKKMSESVDNPRNNINTINNTNNNKTFNNYNINDNMNINNPLLTTNDNIQININDVDNNMINNNSSYLKTSIGINSFNKNSNNYNPLMTSFNLRSAFMNYSQGRKGNNLNDSIMMKKAGATSLKMEIESVADLRNDKTYFGPENLKQKNIFGRNFMKNYKIALIKTPARNPLAHFNKNILTDANWGNKSVEKGPQKENIVFARHHTKQQALRELGSNILSGIKIKLPRDRKVELNK